VESPRLLVVGGRGEIKSERRTEAGNVIIPPPSEGLCQPEFWYGCGSQDFLLSNKFTVCINLISLVLYGCLVKCWDYSVPIWDIRFDLGLHIWIPSEQYNISTQLMPGTLYSPWGSLPLRIGVLFRSSHLFPNQPQTKTAYRYYLPPSFADT
jgi:hypothetical protein